MEDKLLTMLFDTDRWKAAVDKGLLKGINKYELRQLCSEETRAEMYVLIRDGKYSICPPHTALIPKDTPGEFRTVYVNEPKDRVLLSIINDMLFELTPDMIDKSCYSYQKGKSCGQTVTLISKRIVDTGKGVVGWKSDLSKYFDSVPIEYIDKAFDMVEDKFGKSKVIDLLREYYHSDIYFDTDGVLQHQFQSLKQGCAVASWLADVILHEADVNMRTKFGGLYARYSDDTVFIGEKYQEAMEYFESYLSSKSMKLNPKKVECIDIDHWFKFLGYSIKGSNISLSSSAIKKFQKAIEKATIKKRKVSYESALHAVYRELYKGYQGYSWATRVLRVINVQDDIDTLNAFVMDCLRAVQTGKKKLGGLGFKKEQDIGCIARGLGRNVKANREKIPVLDNYITISCMANNVKTCRALYDAVVRDRM